MDLGTLLGLFKEFDIQMSEREGMQCFAALKRKSDTFQRNHKPRNSIQQS